MHDANRLLAAVLLGTLALAAAPRAHAGDGADAFDSSCGDCHSLTPGKNKKGPSLAALYGRKAGSVAGYNYSAAMRASGIVWTPETLRAYLAAPSKVVPNGKMKLDDPLEAGDIAAVSAFLKTGR